MKKILALMPVYNREEMVEEAIKSITDQKPVEGFEIQIIICDDGSTDKTPEILERLKEEGHNLVILKNPLNVGVSHSRNILLGYANLMLTSKEEDVRYLFWQDSDDISHPHRVENSLQALKEQGADIIFTDMYFFNHPNYHRNTRTVNKIDIRKYTSRDGLYNNMNFATAFFKVKLSEFRFKPQLRKKEDVEWITDMINASVVFGHFARPMYFCRRHPGRLTSSND